MAARRVVLRLAAVQSACSARAWAARAGDGAQPADTGVVGRFVADLSANHPLWYAFLSFLAVTIVAFALSIIAGRLMRRLGYRDSRPSDPQGGGTK